MRKSRSQKVDDLPLFSYGPWLSSGLEENCQGCIATHKISSAVAGVEPISLGPSMVPVRELRVDAHARWACANRQRKNGQVQK